MNRHFGFGFLLLVAACGRFGYSAEPADPAAFKHARVTDAWEAYAGQLTFGKGQTLALLDDGCTLSKPEWSMSDGDVPKVRVSYDSVDGDDNPKHEGRGYHGTTIGIPSSVNYKGKLGVAFNNQVAVVRALECCHCNVSDSKTLATGLQWVIDHHQQHRITAINLAPVDDLEHGEPVATEIDDQLKRLRELGIWVSAPAGNHHFTKGISWPACQPNCFAIGAVRPGKDEVHLDRHAKIDLVVPATATSSSNAIVCGAVLLLREAIDKTGYDWKQDGRNLPEAMLAILQKTGPAVADPKTQLTFRRLDVKAALDHVFQNAAAAPAVSFERGDSALAIKLGQTVVASYVFRDEQVPRPYFAHVKTPSGRQVTRRHPPQKDQDAVDHLGLHTGIWLSFGDLSGCDYWRLKAKTEHVRFIQEPSSSAGQGAFVVLNRYRTADGNGTVAEESCRYIVKLISHGYLIDIASEFRPGDADLVFGDQEEMGLGVRVATPLAVDRKLGGRILDSAGRRNGKEVWGQTAEWCDYSGPLDGRWAGLTVLTDPKNFQPSWSHARDYGFLALNPFGRKAFTKQEASRIVVKRGDTFSLRYGVAMHESASEADYSPAEVAREFHRRNEQ